jgi:hypothetical protein
LALHLIADTVSLSILLGTMMSNDDPARRAIKVWMREVMAAKGWSANEWAKRAGTSPTNITRVLSPTSGIIPSGATISKLSRAAGSQPKLDFKYDLSVSSSWQVPLLNGTLFSAFSPRQLWEYVMNPASPLQTIAVDGPVDGPCVVTDVPALGMVARGITVGDRILVERMTARDLEPGNVVLFQHDGATKIGEWQGSLIVFYPATSSDVNFRPIKASEADVYGRVRRLIREL